MSKLKAITSLVVEKNLGYEIKEESVSYYLLYRIMIETGISFSQVRLLKVSSFREQSSITYTTRTGSLCKEAFSEDTIATIRDYIADKSNDDYMFVNKFNNSPVGATNFKRILDKYAKKIQYPYPVNMAVLKRTYFFHLLERTDDINSYKKRFNLRLDKEIFDYLGIDSYPHKILVWSKNVYNLHYENTDIEQLKEEFNSFLSSLEYIYKEDTLPDVVYKESCSTLNLITQSLQEYKDFRKKSGID